ncbi:MAG TPA: DALR domain-containing protein, partial [Polyangiaceae bacterium]
ERILAALDKDLNTPQALAVLADLAKAANEIVMQVPKLKNDEDAQAAARRLAGKAVKALDESCAPLGLMQTSGEVFAARTKERRLRLRGLDAAAIDTKVQARSEARATKDFARGDALRKELVEMGVEVLDGPNGSTCKVTI